jgi:isoleucyl-tRNA synthetase
VPGFDQPVPGNLFRLERAPDSRWGVAEDGDLLVALDLEVTDELKREGIVRDLVRQLQLMRKEAGLSVSQRIELGLATESRLMQDAICAHRAYIMDELLSVRLEMNSLEGEMAHRDLAVEGETVHATLRWPS